MLDQLGWYSEQIVEDEPRYGALLSITHRGPQYATKNGRARNIWFYVHVAWLPSPQ